MRRGHRERRDAQLALRQAMDHLLASAGVRAASAFIDVSGSRLHYLDAGQGPALVLIQGAGGGAANWFRVMGPLSARFRVLALDVPGFGLSERIRPRYPLGRQMAEVVLGWLRALGIGRCSVVGTSFGGLVALRLTQCAPDVVRRLVLLDATGLGRDLPLLVRLTGLPRLGRMLLRPSRSGTAWVLRHLLTADRRTLGVEGEAALVEYLWRSAAAGDPAMMARAFRLFTDCGGQREVLSDRELEALRVPALVVWGERDRFLPMAHGERAARQIPGCTFRLIRGAGHSPNWEAPDALLAATVPFLTAGGEPA